VGSLSFDGVRFQIYSDDHEPRHAHAWCSSTMVVVEFSNPEDIHIRRASLQPPNAKRRDIRRILDTAEEHLPELMQMWETTHG
jgi:hypothetical protein